MGDRVNCTLDIWGITTASKFEAICQALSYEEGWDVDEVREALTARNAYIEEVDGGDLAQPIIHAIKAAGLGFSWDWGTGAEFQEGFEIYDPRSGEHITCLTVNQDVHVPLGKVDDVEFVARARRALEIIKESSKLPLIVAESSHEFVEALAQHPELKAFAPDQT